MISNERPSPFARRPQPQRSTFSSSPYPQAYSKPPSNETTLRSERLQVERKTFLFTLKENDRGRFLRIVEEANGHRDMIIIPATGLEDFNKILSDIVAQPQPQPDQPATVD
ncbi:MAG: PurA-like ssDNA and RNA-binding protein [Verrucomicrobiales bacterium]|nr:PurA-like ssDNA and RNA-binding protein [Verrucomicrobiales bacterium]